MLHARTPRQFARYFVDGEYTEQGVQCAHKVLRIPVKGRSMYAGNPWNPSDAESKTCLDLCSTPLLLGAKAGMRGRSTLRPSVMRCSSNVLP